MVNYDNIKMTFEGTTASNWDDKSKLFQIVTGKDNLINIAIDFWGFDGMAVLDVGCGTGKILSHINSSFQNCDIHGVDFSEDMINMTKNRMNQSKAQWALYNRNFMECNLPDEYFDMIIFKFVLHHMPEPMKALQKAKKLLHKGGVILVYVPGAKHFREIFPYKNQNDILGRTTIHNLEMDFASLGLTSLILEDCRFFMRFECYEEFELFLRRTGNYQRVVEYLQYDWSSEFVEKARTKYLLNKSLSGNFLLGVSTK